mgnify:CR=1 FL=1
MNKHGMYGTTAARRTKLEGRTSNAAAAIVERLVHQTRRVNAERVHETDRVLQRARGQQRVEAPCQ